MILAGVATARTPLVPLAFYAFGMLGLCLLSAGCVNTGAAYPTDWPRVESSANASCAVLSGVYQDQVMIPTDDHLRRNGLRGSLTGHLLTLAGKATANKYTDEQLNRVDFVEIKVDDEEMTFSATANGSVLTTGYILLADNGADTCKKGELVFKKIAGGGFAPLAGGVGVEYTTFTLATDGSLIMKETSKGLALLIVVPVVGTDTLLSRYSRVAP